MKVRLNKELKVIISNVLKITMILWILTNKFLTLNNKYYLQMLAKNNFYLIIITIYIKNNN